MPLGNRKDKNMKGNVEQYDSGAGKETLGLLKEFSRGVSLYRCTQLVVGNPLVTGPLSLNCAGLPLASG